MTTPATVTNNAPATVTNGQGTISEKFVARIEKQFAAELGSPVSWTPIQRTLAQHLYVRCDQALIDAESRRQSNRNKTSDPPITWANVDMTKLTMRAVHCVALELDAYAKNQLFFVPYLNKRTGKYDVDIRIGYAGEDHCSRKFALDEIVDIRYQLVYKGDAFGIHTNDHGVEVYTYQPADYFEPGPVIGGFGYVMYADPRKNRVIPIARREFDKAQRAAQGTEFWGGPQARWENGKRVEGEFDEKFYNEMCYKTIVHRVNKTIPKDPTRVNMAVLDQMTSESVDAVDAEFATEIEDRANATPLALPEANSDQAPDVSIAAAEPKAVADEEGPGY
jgi:recombination protein RecT